MSEAVLTLSGKISLLGKEMKITFEGVCDLPPVLPPSVKFVTFGKDFDQDVSQLDFCEVQEIRFGRSFNQDVSQIKLPETLRLLSFSGKFNCSLKDLVLPKSLEVLFLLGDFNSDLPKLPKGLQTLLLGKKYKGSLPEVPTLVVAGKFLSSSDPRILEVL